MYSSALNPNNVPAGNAKYMKTWIQDYVPIMTVQKCYRAGENISAGKGVYMSTDGFIYTYDTANDDSYLGVASESKKAGDFVNVVYQGFLRLDGAGWVAGVVYHLDGSGNLTGTNTTRKVAVGIGNDVIQIYTQLDAGVSALIAQNGLNSPALGTVELGGTLLQNTTINIPDGLSLTYLDNITNSYSTYVAGAQLHFDARPGSISFIQTTFEGLPGMFEQTTADLAYANTVQTALALRRTVDPSAVGNGVGAELTFEISNETNYCKANAIVSKLTNVTGYGASQLEFYGKTSTSTTIVERLGYIKNTGQWAFDKYGVGTFADTPTYLLGVKADGTVVESSYAGIVTADNGLTESPSNNVQLGGTLTKNTTINCGTYYARFSSGTTASANPLSVIALGTSATGINIFANFTTGTGIDVTAYRGFYGHGGQIGVQGAGSTYGVYGTSGGSGYGVFGSGGYAGVRGENGQYAGVHGYATDAIYGVIAEKHSLDNVAGGLLIDVYADSQFSPTANYVICNTVIQAAPETFDPIYAGFGTNTIYSLKNNSPNSSKYDTSNIIISRWTNPDYFNLESEYVIQGRTSGTGLLDLFTIIGTGQQKLNKYGTGFFTGTPTHIISTDASGNLIETGNGTGLPLMWYGSFFDTTDQTATGANTPTAMKLNTTDISSGVSVTNNGLGNPTRITFANAGVYNIQFSAQLYRSSGGSSEVVTIWFRKNEINIPSSSTNLSLQANADYLVAAWNSFVSVTAGQYVELMWSTTSTAITIEALPENLVVPYPAVPSLIVTANRVS